jgi:hypothetical protein
MPGRPRLIVYDHGYALDGIFYHDVRVLATKELHLWPHTRLPIVRDHDLTEVVAHVKLRDLASGKVDFDKLIAGEPAETED